MPSFVPVVSKSTFMGLLMIALAAGAAMAAFVTRSGPAREHVVEVITDYQTMQMRFEPQVLRIRAGDTVRWVNRRNSTHNVTTYPDGYPEAGHAFHSPFMQRAGQSWAVTFKGSGTYEYHCIPHILVGMRGTIIVGERSTPDEMNRPRQAEVRIYRDRLLEFFEAEEIREIPEFIRLNRKPVAYAAPDAQRASWGGADA